MNHLSTIQTPQLLLKYEQFKKNCDNMIQHLNKHNITFRPHGKTAKNIKALNHTFVKNKKSIIVSTVKEAIYFFEQGITDITYGVGISNQNMQLLVPLLKKQANISVILDSLQQVAMLKKIAKQDKVIIQVYIEVDCDQHRAGVSVNDPLLIAMGKAIDQSLQLYLKGVLLHAGESYNCKSIADIEVLSRHEKTTAIECKKN